MLGYFNGVLESTLNEYLNLISTKHGIKFSELKDLMNDVKGNDGATAAPPAVVIVKKAVQPQAEGTSTTCGYLPQRGKNVGIVCGKKVKKNSNFCAAHSKKTDAAADVTIEVETKNAPVPKKPNPVLRKNNIIDKWWHPDSGLVFKSSDEKIVIGIYKDEQICDLTDEDVATCIAYKFKYVTKRKRVDYNDDDDNGEQPKKQKVEKPVVNVIDDKFIKVNQDAKNVEVIIKEMFDDKSKEDDDDADDEEHDDPLPDWDGNGAEETKENYTIQVEDEDDVVEEDIYEEEELLLEEEDS
jgi:hypothetical protein